MINLLGHLRVSTARMCWTGLRAVGTFGLILLPLTILSAQTERPASREIVAEDFTRNRPAQPIEPGGGTVSSAPATGRQSQSAKKKSLPSTNKRVYRLAASTGPGPNRPVPASKVVQLGVTIWRLRPAKAGDTGGRMLVIENTKSSEWVAERIEADTPIGIGDRVRISIESPRSGYLYIVDRDLFADGSTGDALLIFPTLGTRGGDNELVAGKLIDIPAQDDRQNYFTANPVRSDQVGEILTIIVSAAPLDLPIAARPTRISAADLARWEKAWGSTAERFEMLGGAGQDWTKAERQAGREKGARQLTQDDPPPQTIYRIGTRDEKTFLVNVRLNYGR